MTEDFWAPRDSFFLPIPEVEAAADLIAKAVDSLLAGDEGAARSYVETANIPALRAYTQSIAGKFAHHIHRLREVPGLPTASLKSSNRPRQPIAAVALDIFRRDGFRCRYCGCRVFFPKVERTMSARLPGAVRWGNHDADLNAAFYTLKGVLDHVDPYAFGGTSEPGNMVVSCQPCNYGKNNWFLQQVGLNDPRLRPPKVDTWDGLIRLLTPAVRAEEPDAGPTRLNPSQVKRKSTPVRSNKLPQRDLFDLFAASFDVQNQRHLNNLVKAVESCSELGVCWSLQKTFMVKITVGSATLYALGVEADATVQIPWSIGPYKKQFRPFAETLAAALPRATVYETEKMWRVKCDGRTPSITDLMQDPEAVPEAFKALHRAFERTLQPDPDQTL